MQNSPGKLSSCHLVMAITNLFAYVFLSVIAFLTNISSVSAQRLDPPAPNATYFGDFNLYIQNFLEVGSGPRGTRIVANGASGNFTGPNIEGKSH